MPDLAAALARHSIELPQDRLELLERYCRLLWEWNEKINLTRHTDFERFVARDVVDSLTVARQLAEGERVLDVGSGGGVPGIVLAIVRPDLKVTLSESVGKKSRVLADIVERMGLPIEVYAGRAEERLASKKFDSLVIRAVAPLTKLLLWFSDMWSQFDRLLAIKGPAWIDERHEAREKNQLRAFELRKLATWELPGTESESVLLEIKPKRTEGTSPAGAKQSAVRPAQKKRDR
jgi:16S rRNA (guanine527-N7)-methyltransferase